MPKVVPKFDCVDAAALMFGFISRLKNEIILGRFFVLQSYYQNKLK